jgi:hypothetical protein
MSESKKRGEGDKGDMTVSEAGRKGGEKVKEAFEAKREQEGEK